MCKMQWVICNVQESMWKIQCVKDNLEEAMCKKQSYKMQCNASVALCKMECVRYIV